MARRLVPAIAATLPLTLAISFAAGMSLSTSAYAQLFDHHEGHGAAAPKENAQATNVVGRVTMVDAGAGLITIGMENGHSIPFLVKDPAMLRAVKQGDRVTFNAERVNGQYTLTRIQKTN